VLRSTILTIVLTLAAAPAARLICQAACDPRLAAESGCHHSHDGTTTTVASIDNCSTQPLLAVTPARDDTRRVVAPQNEVQAVLDATCNVAAGLVSHDIRSYRRAAIPIQRRPLTPILRI
jgi:hypothetical protein